MQQPQKNTSHGAYIVHDALRDSSLEQNRFERQLLKVTKLDVSAIHEPHTNVTTYLQSQALPRRIQEMKLLVLFSAPCYFYWPLSVGFCACYFCL